MKHEGIIVTIIVFLFVVMEVEQRSVHETHPNLRSPPAVVGTLWPSPFLKRRAVR
jgi:hypothetical protein